MKAGMRSYAVWMLGVVGVLALGSYLCLAGGRPAAGGPKADSGVKEVKEETSLLEARKHRHLTTDEKYLAGLEELDVYDKNMREWADESWTSMTRTCANGLMNRG